MAVSPKQIELLERGAFGEMVDILNLHHEPEPGAPL
jgi:hypothetical protein